MNVSDTQYKKIPTHHPHRTHKHTYFELTRTPAQSTQHPPCTARGLRTASQFNQSIKILKEPHTSTPAPAAPPHGQQTLRRGATHAWGAKSESRKCKIARLVQYVHACALPTVTVTHAVTTPHVYLFLPNTQRTQIVMLLPEYTPPPSRSATQTRPTYGGLCGAPACGQAVRRGVGLTLTLITYIHTNVPKYRSLTRIHLLKPSRAYSPLGHHQR